VARFKAPTRVHFVDALPKSNIGKMLRRVLRETAIAQCQSTAEPTSQTN
jgi:acyl-coenzyme A synthetase/AMP-(fatty) acid ligase